MSEKIIDDLASQVANFYKAGGRYTLYGSVTPRAFKEGKDPALSYGRVTNCSLNIFDTNTKVGVVAFLEPSDPAFILEKVKANMQKADESSADTSADYYTTTVVYGPYKGRTIADFVQNASKDEITAEYNRLRSTTDKYPRNGVIAQSIYSAIKAQSEGALATGKGIETIIEEVKTPNNKDLDSRGLTLCRTISIKYHRGLPEPYIIKIQNFMAPPTTGLVGAKFSQAQDMKDLSMSLNEKEMFSLFDEMIRAKEMYARATEGRRIQYASSKAWKPEA